MPVGPPGWTCRMHWEHECEFVLMAWELASVEAGFVAWVGPKVLKGIEGVVSFYPHFLVLLPGGEFWGGGVGEWGGGGGVALGWGGGVGGISVRGVGGGE